MENDNGNGVLLNYVVTHRSLEKTKARDTTLNDIVKARHTFCQHTDNMCNL